MKRFLRRLVILTRSALRGLQTSPVTSVIAVGTIAIALVLVGAFAIVVGNMQSLIDRFGEEIEVTAFLTPELDPAGAERLAEKVRSVEVVEAVRVVTPAEAMERFREDFGGSSLLEGLDENPLPASLEIALREEHRNASGLAILKDALSGLRGIDEFARADDWVEGYARAAALVRAAAFVLGVVLSLAALLIVANTIRLAIHAREDEIEIMALVGAGRVFVRTPFLIEGTLQGAAGGATAVLALYLGFRLIVPEVASGFELLLGSAAPEFLHASGMLWLIGGGAGLGLLGSLAALTSFRS